MARGRHLGLTVLLVLAVLLSISYLTSGPADSPLVRDEHPLGADLGRTPPPEGQQQSSTSEEEVNLPVLKDGQKPQDAGFVMDLDDMPESMLEGDSIAPKLENATLKAELGRATWKFMHTMVARFPEKPSADDRRTLDTFIHLFGRLYPCGDCARHFRGLLARYPPQTSSRNAAAGWLCFVHNLVNERLEKPQFDCNDIGDFYDCGCGEEGKEEDKDGKTGDKSKDKPEADKTKGKDEPDAELAR